MISLTGKDLASADFATAEELNRLAEEASFRSFQKIRIRWTPARELLIAHMAQQMDKEYSTRRAIRLLALGFVLEGAAIVALLVMQLR